MRNLKNLAPNDMKYWKPGWPNAKKVWDLVSNENYYRKTWFARRLRDWLV